jgi:hypothetical protein
MERIRVLNLITAVFRAKSQPTVGASKRVRKEEQISLISFLLRVRRVRPFMSVRKEKAR